MKIIFSPAKDMDLSNPIWDEQVNFNDNTFKIIEEINKLSEDEIKSALKINDNIYKDVDSFYKNITKEPFYKSIYLYNGLSFRQIEKSFTKEEQEYLNKNLLILSALYGPIKAFDLISPYRLDMNVKIKIDGNNLKKYWKDIYNSYFLKDEVIFNLASDEFSNLIDRDKVKIIDFEFFMRKDGKLKSHSTTSKKARGLMLDFCIKNNINSVEDLISKEIERLEFIKIENNKLTYILKD